MAATARLTTVFAMVTDMTEATRFVRTALALEPSQASPFWTEFDTGEAHLALHLSEGPAPAADDGHGPGSVHISVSVPDLDGAVVRLRAAGYRVGDPTRLEGMRSRSSDSAGPDGLHLHLVQA